MKKPAILIARAIFPETLAHLSQHFEVDTNQGDEVLSHGQQYARRVDRNHC